MLRPLVANDLDWLTDSVSDPEANGLLGEGPKSHHEARKLAEAMIGLDLARYQFGHWVIQDKNTGANHGWTALTKLRPWSGPSDEFAVSFALRRASWGQGFATEAAGHLVRYGFEVQELERVMAVTLAGNVASRRVLEKIGMHFVKGLKSADGRMLQYFGIDGPENGPSNIPLSSK